MGRPKGSKSLKRAMVDESNETIEVAVNGEKQEISKVEALSKVTYKKALAGDNRMISLLFQYLHRFDLEDANDMEPRPLTKDEQEYYFDMALRSLLGTSMRKLKEARRAEMDAVGPTAPDHEEF